MNPKTITLIMMAFSLTACGGDSAENGPKTDAPKAAKYKGSKLAPPSEAIQASVADRWFNTFGFSKVRIANKQVCKDVSHLRPQEWSAECAALMNDWKARTAFTPTECRKGDEREGYNGVLENAVSCTGLLEDPRGQERRIFVFHTPKGEWKAWLGPSFPGTRTNFE